ncbi:hypothetical protein [Aeromonas sobria]|uniref:hypothetical protein n=1 Tax=Aeromonas sobria TaxID=646 RepID=UPI0012FEE8E9|nr:hypothetical protein [Aeromonas sobria]
MRIGWLLLFFPSLAFALGGCPVGVQLGNVTIATQLPVCLKFESSEFGGCLVDCRGVCVELPLANTRGPVETTGTSCNYAGNGSGNGDSDGSGNTPDEGNSGTKPISGWVDFQPVIGDSTGTSVSGSVAKLNKNLGVALRQVVDATQHNTANINLIAHSAESLARDMKASIFRLDRMTDDISYTKTSTDAALSGIYKTNEHLQTIISKMDGSGSSGGGSGFGDKQVDDLDAIRRNMGAISGTLLGIDDVLRQSNSFLASTSGIMPSVMNSLASQGDYGVIGKLGSIESLLKSGSGSGSGEGGQGVDYSKMPGSADNPLSVGGSTYNSSCSGEGCFFDVPAMDKKLADTNKSLTDKYASIAEDVKQVFSFSLTGSADPMECLDLFTHQGKEYTICPPSGDYWKTLAALMMFIFYFVALMIIFKR